MGDYRDNGTGRETRDKWTGRETIYTVERQAMQEITDRGTGRETRDKGTGRETIDRETSKEIKSIEN